MGLLIALAVLAVLGIPVAVVGLLVGHARLRRRVDELEALMQAVAAGFDRSAATLAARAGQNAEDASTGPWAAMPEMPEMPEEAATAADAAAIPEPPPLPGMDPAGAAPAEAPVRQDYPVVMRRDRLSALAGWLSQNWVYAVSALSLALAGVFFVQYGIENGILSPRVRVLMSLGFGALLVTAGEWMRRRWGDGVAAATAYLPSTFSGAGLVSMFAGIVAARQLYGLIGPEVAMPGLVAVAAAGVVLGWLHGPFLVAIGLIGATAAPFVVGGESDNASWLYAYFALVTLTGLAVDAWRRWAWVSVLALGLGFAGGMMLHAGTWDDGIGLSLMLAGLALLAIAVPQRRLWPDHEGPTITEALIARGKAGWPDFPVRLAAGAMGVATVSLLLLASGTDAAALGVLVLLAVLVLGVALWAAAAPGLADLAALPAAAFLVRIVVESEGGTLAGHFRAAAIALRPPETAPPATASLLLGLAALGTLAAAWRSLRGGPHRAVWAAGAALFAPVAALLLELCWMPAAVIGAYPWALHVIALAVVMVLMAGWFARADRPDMRRAAYATLSALSLIALALFLILASAALTLALAVLVVVAALLDRRFDLREMGWFIQAGVLVLGWRLTVDPGLDWAFGAGWGAMLVAFAAAIAGMVVALRLVGARDRRSAAVFLESGIAAYAAVLANVVIFRLIDERTTGDYALSYWSLSLNALPWLVVMLAQLYRMQLGGWMRFLRGALAALAGLCGLGGLAAAAIPANPLFGLLGSLSARIVLGPPVIDTLLVAYGLPAAMLAAGGLRMGHVGRWMRLALAGIGLALAALYAGLEIRRFWRGDDLAVPGVTQPELYSYTVALLLLGAGLLYQAIAARSPRLRRVAMAVIALTIAKVFLIDASGLSGLTRVFSFLALGLCLAALAWLNRWAAGRADGERGSDARGAGAG